MDQSSRIATREIQCTGNFVIGAAHLSYTGSVATQALKDMKKIAAGQTVTSK